MRDTEKDIDSVLIFMNEIIEDKGVSIKSCVFSFNEEDKDYNQFLKNNDSNQEILFKVLRICMSRRLIERKYMGGGDFGGLALTDEGQGRALASKLGKNRSYELGAAMSIANMTINGPTQVGNNNSQSIKICFETINREIDAASATEEDKKEAKSILKKLLEHPLICSIVGGVIS